MRVELDDDYDVKALRRLLGKVEYDPESGCWVFTGAKIPTGYGLIGYRRKMTYAHRLSYELFFGAIPDGLVIDHVKARGCRHRSCVNPRHLQPVTQKTNLRRGNTLAAANAAKTHCPQGHEYTPENTYDYGRGRVCKTCRRESMHKYKARKRMELASAA
ncbi:HNH endonuclease signature motif containing protein [Streptomyces albus]|uniref:HNH endonuclease signature motif containing protein n=1 Tax=Streptomyces sp. NRRL F-5917 TaxID=1463873 RepID=UPI0018FECA28